MGRVKFCEQCGADNTKRDPHARFCWTCISLRQVVNGALAGAIALCVKAAELEPKELQIHFKWDKGQWSRWESGEEGVKWPKLKQLMDYCGNEAPLLWLLHDRRFDISSVRRIESDVERENRLLREENTALRRVLTGAKP